jgi:hypothetical protein
MASKYDSIYYGMGYTATEIFEIQSNFIDAS